MHELTANELFFATASPVTAIYVRLTYRPGYTFEAERRALKRLGAAYRPDLRAWRLPDHIDDVTALQRLLARTSAVVYAVDDWEEGLLTADNFE